VRTGLMFLSCVLHGAVVTTALGFGVYAGRRLQAPAPLVQIATSQPSAPADAAALLEPPAVVVEAVVEPELVTSEPVVEPPPPSVDEQTPLRQPRAPSLARVRSERPAEPAAAPSELPPVEPAPSPAAAEALPDVDAEPRADNEPPRYPEEARRRGQEGTVVVRAEVAADGLVLDVSLQTPSPYPELNREALRAVRRWRVEPARRGGIAVPVATPVVVVFRLENPR
jgi:periplasmic protein TonB